MNILVAKMKSLDYDKIYLYLIVSFAFTMPLSRAAISFFILLLFFVWIIERDFKKINRSKTYFFGLEQTDYIETLVSLKGTVYYFINRSSNYYNVAYLNYTSASITPTFRFGIDCCFSRKINKTNYSYCSPF